MIPTDIFPLLTDPAILAAAGVPIFLIIVLPAFFNWQKTVRCPKCHKWFRLEYQDFEVRDKVVGHSNTRCDGGPKASMDAVPGIW